MRFRILIIWVDLAITILMFIFLIMTCISKLKVIGLLKLVLSLKQDSKLDALLL